MFNFDSTANPPESQDEHQQKARIHSFDLNVAEVCGVHAAVILYNFRFWIVQNMKNNRNFRDGYYWTFQTVSELCVKFPYLTANQIRTAIDKLEKGGYILKGNYNQSGYDRTTWYTITKAGYALFSDCETTNALVKNYNSICEKTQMEAGNFINGNGKFHNSIRGEDITTDVETSNSVKDVIIPPNPPKGGTGESFPDSPEPVDSAGTDKWRRQRRKRESAETVEPLSPEEESRLLSVSPRLSAAVRDWVVCKAESRHALTPTQKRALLEQIHRNVGQYGADIVAQTVEESTASGYAGIAWSRAAQMKKAKEDEARAQEERKKELPSYGFKIIGDDEEKRIAPEKRWPDFTNW